MLKSTLSAIALCVVALSSACAQMLDEEQARDDLATLYEGLREAHYDLYATTSEHVFDGAYAELMEQLAGPISVSELHRKFQRFTALARHGHARIEGLNPGFSAHLDAGGLVFPLDFVIRDGAVIVVGAPQGSTLEVGDEILAINDEPNGLWLARVTRNISAETPGLAYSILERTSPYAMWLAYGAQDQFTIDVDGPRGRRTAILHALDYPTYAAQPVVSSGPDLSGRDAFMISETIAYLRPGPFYNVDATTPAETYHPDAVSAFVAFVDGAFEGFIEEGADTLILDLRDNPGGTNAFSDPVLQWIAREPFRFYSEFRMRVSPQTTASNALRLDQIDPSEAGVSGTFAELFGSVENGEIVLFEQDYVQPLDRGFNGQVYALINQGSYSNAVSVGTIIQDYGMGQIVGVPTTDMATMYGAMEHFYLPHSGLQVGYPKAHIIRPNGDDRLHVLSPDIEIDVPLMSGDRDIMLERLVEMIEA